MARLVAGLLIAALPSIGLAQGDVGGAGGAARRTPPGFADRLAELARSAPSPELHRGDHAIRGRVVTETGEPLARVTIRATPTDYPFATAERHTFIDAPPEATTLARSLLGSADFWYSNACDSREAVTATDGSFTLDGLVDRLFELRGWCKGFAIEPLGSSWHGRISTPVDATVDFTAIPIVSKRFELVLPDGSRPERATLELLRFGDRGMASYDSWTPDLPTILIPAGDWYVTATVGSMRSSMLSAREAWFASRPALVTALPQRPGEAESLEAVKCELRGVPAIEGTIHRPSNAPRTYMKVVAVPLETKDEPDPGLFKGAKWRSNRRIRDASMNSSSDRGETFRLGPIDPGRWFVGVLESGSDVPVTSAVIEVGEGMVRHDFTLQHTAAKPVVRVSVLDPEGNRLRDCRFHCTAMFANSGTSKTRQTSEIQQRTQVGGAFALARDDLGTESVLFAEHPRFGRRALAVPPDASDLELRFAEPATAALRLTGFAEHKGKRSVEIEVRDVTDPAVEPPPLRLEEKAIDDDGTVALGALQPGSYRIRVFADSDPYDGRSGFEVAAATFELAAGPRTLELSFPSLGEVRVAVAASSKGNYTLSRIDSTSVDDDRTRRNAEAAADGLITFTDVPPGLYEVRAPDNRFMAVEAPSSKVIAFVAEAVNAQRVVITDATGKLAKAGLKSGDFIVAIDGREFATREELDRIRQSLRGEEVTLTIRRGEKLFEVVVPRALLSDERAAGGRFRDASR